MIVLIILLTIALRNKNNYNSKNKINMIKIINIIKIIMAILIIMLANILAKAPSAFLCPLPSASHVLGMDAAHVEGGQAVSLGSPPPLALGLELACMLELLCGPARPWQKGYPGPGQEFLLFL